MTRLHRIARIAAVAAALAGALTMPSAASAAPCSEVRDTAGSNYNVRLCGVSDIDQFRTGGPGLLNNGNAYCGPASLYNTMRYMRSAQGAPITAGVLGAIPDPASAPYESVTDWLWYVGLWTGSNGSNTADNRFAFDIVNNEAEEKGWTFSSSTKDSNLTAEFGYEIAKAQTRAPVQIFYGRYTQNASGWVRNGGHIVTVVGASGTIGSGQVQLQIHDPGRAPDHGVGNYLETQSPTYTHTVTLKKRVLTFGVFGSDSYKKVTRWELSGESWGAGAMVEGFNAYTATKP